MDNREPIQIVEIDLQFCGRVFGVAPCMASLTGSTVRKCYHTFGTCRDSENFLDGIKTLKCEADWNDKLIETMENNWAFQKCTAVMTRRI